ncbi:MAG: hypothetical protein H7A40_03295 [Chlamydiales bacterium]|nr:hypothetical protein [Chlamydiales bacterium]
MSIGLIRLREGYAQCTNGNGDLETALKKALLDQNWETTLHLLQNYDFETYPPSTLMHVIHNADTEIRKDLFDQFFQNDKNPFDEEEISKALLIAATDNHQDVIEFLMKKPFATESSPNVKNAVNYIPKGPEWGIALFNCARYGLVTHVHLIFENTGIFYPSYFAETAPSDHHCQALTEDEMRAAFDAAVEEAEKLPEYCERRTNIEIATQMITNKMIMNKLMPGAPVNPNEFCRTN